jgi:Mn2+/Fe2+ NRAMP family transporter
MQNNLLKYIGPGLVIAATGVGAGDLAGGAFAGSKLGVAILWAVVLGAFFKYVINEGLARYQLATGSTLLEGLFSKFGKPVEIFFLIYLLIWSFAVGSAMISACGVAAHALIPIFGTPEQGKIFWGVIHSLIGLIIVWRGNYGSFEKIMSTFVALMFVSVVVTSIFIKPDYSEILKGIFIPSIPKYFNPDGNEQGVVWTLALMDGVGGTLTILSYGYWIREKGWNAANFLKRCRIDLAVAYGFTALFGMSMIIIASNINLDQESSAKLVITLSEKLKSAIGTAGSILFLLGAWSAVFTSLLGVWQSVPYMFADFWQMFLRNKSDIENFPVDTKGKPYRIYLIAISFVPMVGLAYKFVVIQKAYAVLGSLVIPLVSLALLFLNRKKDLKTFSNKLATDILLFLIIALFIYIGLPEILGNSKGFFN